METVETLYEALYVSTLAPGHAVSVVAAIAGRARQKNAELGITGLLIFDGQRFCQQLEGPAATVAPLIECIRSDPRHVDVAVIHESRLKSRRFQQFSLAFSTVEDADALARLERLRGRDALAAFETVCNALEL
jgi:hypothetical protein